MDVISIIVPAFNKKEYIEKTLLSILKQTYPIIEIIVVDDGSTDGTEVIVKKIMENHPSVRYLYQENKGVSFARWQGIQIASGQLIGFVDADDELNPHMYEYLISNMKKEQADISMCGVLNIDRNGNEISLYGTGQYKVLSSEESIAALIEGKIEPGLCNKLYKRALIEEAFQSDLMNFEIRVNEDLLLNYIVFKKISRLVYEDRLLYRYISRENSVTRKTKAENFLDPIRVTKTIYADLPETSFLINYIQKRFIRCLIFGIIQTKIPEVSKICLDEIKNVSKIDLKKAGLKMVLISKFVVEYPTLYRGLYRIYNSIRWGK